MRKVVVNYFIVIFTVGILLLAPATTAFSFVNNQVAAKVLGQGGFTSNDSTSASTTSLKTPVGTVVDASGNVWVADADNNRVLKFAASPSTNDPAIIVLGQPDFTQNTANNGGLSSNSLFSPQGLAFDGDGNLWVADTGNNRVLMFSDGDTNTATSNFVNNQAASKVLGQPNFVSNFPNQGGAISASTLSHPRGIHMDLLGVLWVSDSANNRVLQYSDGDLLPTTNTFSDGQAASVVIGQPNFVSGLPNQGTTTTNALKLNHPNGITMTTDTGDRKSVV